MDTGADTSSVASRRARAGFGRINRLAVVLAALVGGTLAMAAPGFAAGEPVVPEIPSPPELPTIAPSVMPIDSTPPPAPESEPSASIPTEPVTVTVDADAGNIDVSVRVLSPGEDASATAEPPVISGSESPDTTAAPAPMPELPAGSSGDDAHGSNTNVTVRVLSPGDDGPVVQSTSPDDEKPGDAPAGIPTAEGSGGAETPAAAADDSAPDAANDPSGSPDHGEQYQDQDSRYQSGEQFADDAWSWIWHLSLDCDGNATSSSTETGLQSSRDWTWEWTWEWACGSPPHPPPIDSLEPPADDEPTQGAPAGSDSTRTSTMSSEGAASDTAAAREPWLWTWTFTFCGETVTATLPIDAEAGLEWVWEWVWTWTCQGAPATGPSETSGGSAAGDPSPALATAGPSQPSGGAPGSGTTADERQPEGLLPWITRVDLPEWVISLLPPELADATIPLVPAIEAMTSVGPFTMTGDVVPIQLSLDAPGTPVAAADPPITLGTTVISRQPPRGRKSASTATAHWPVAADSSLPRRAQPHSVEPRAEKAPPRATRRSTARSGGNPLVLWPPLRPFQAAAGPGASSSFVPSVSVFGTAALVALFVLAAPGFGRRIRVARELRPRGTYGSSIDHPG